MIGRYEKTFSFISLGDQLEQHAGFSLVLPDVGQVIQDNQIEAIEFGEKLRAALEARRTQDADLPVFAMDPVETGITEKSTQFRITAKPPTQP